MQVTAEMILHDFGTKLPLDRRRKDALADYCRQAARAADARSTQGWIEKTFDLKAYEAKDVAAGRASETLFERIIKHPNGGWPVTLAVMGAVIGQSLADHLASEQERLRHEQQRFAAREAHLSRLEAGLREDRSFGGSGRG